ncbi:MULTISPECIES: threonine synthase [Rhizobium]|uniref:Pyridoxal-phosphate dependent enzyme n=1 Tax=Rhizobium tropici TaxID=398 RepID=A0A6P1CH58_RHITR|nr:MULTISPECIES: threonine synthase [Rhizobium]AGB73925.1 L-threonine synthase [Rhizobium tropici CIAT 899]MBB4245390.1 threonine synthase [Rhizobium tropici]MBB5596735.1 threonine synthase [Rhizobium tropici]MBB6495741.1 threonine synthase [Rhizobium tropici]NEV15113.1 pyridoxal-phosphate dependent enzyme [Rhizobium tropici]
MSKATYVDPITGRTYPLEIPRWCSDEQTPLLITPQVGISRDEIERDIRSLWRYRASLPIRIEAPISLGEGCTPLVQGHWEDFRPYFKLEWFNPTLSFKDRGTTVMLSAMRQLGVDAVLEDSSGNGGASVAAYGAAGGMRVKIFAPSYTSPAKIAQVGAYGAEVELVDGPREESQAMAIRQSKEVFYCSHNWQPFFLQGTKSFAYELWEDFNFSVPDNIVAPAGAGSTLLGCYIGFQELKAAGQIDKLPRLFAAQPFNCSPIDASFKAGVDDPVERGVRKTLAEGTAIREPLRLRQLVDALRQTGGSTVAVSEQDIIATLKKLGRAGLLAEPTSATAAAALDHLIRDKMISERENTVVILTGTGIKSAQVIAEIFE